MKIEYIFKTHKIRRITQLDLLNEAFIFQSTSVSLLIVTLSLSFSSTVVLILFRSR